jgi:hypothetical protein
VPLSYNPALLSLTENVLIEVIVESYVVARNNAE